VDKKIVIDHTPQLTRTALLEDGRLAELIIDDAGDESIVGNVYAGQIKAILPNQFAFVDIGRAKNAFVYLNDGREKSLIRDNKLLIKNGQTLIVQVVKDPIGTKGAYVTTNLSFTGRYLVLSNPIHNQPSIGISKKITDPSERGRLKSIFQTHNANVIIRTNAENVPSDVLLDELGKLQALQSKSQTIWPNAHPPSLLHKEAGNLRKHILDLYTDGTEVIVSDTATQTNIMSILADIPDSAQNIKLYGGGVPIFDAHNVSAQLERAANKRVWLKSGGFIVIERTEACWVIDVNSGKFVGRKSHEDTVLQVNLEAAATIAEQLRLRNLSGIIIVDFIDMRDPQNIKHLTDYLSQEVKKDRLSVNVIGMTELGLMQLTRKKTRKPLDFQRN
jgi:ribonuclease G